MGNAFFAAFIHNKKDAFFGKLIFGVLVVGKCPPKFDWAIKKSKFNFVVEYPTWVSIKRTLTGNFEADGQNVIYCAHFKEKVPKPSKIEHFPNSAIFGVFWTFS